MNKRHLKATTSFLVLITTLLYCLCGDSSAFLKPANPGYVRVIKVHDGDTISVILNGRKEKVRLIGIDAPELRQRPWGSRAKKRLKELLSSAGWRVILDFDVEKADRYGRLLGYLITSEGSILNVRMVKDGYAVLLTIPPNIKYVDELKMAQNEARQYRQGIWSGKGLKESPSDYRKKHPYR